MKFAQIEVAYQNTVKININMRCIEMRKKWQNYLQEAWININMRCIEIKHISILIKGQAWININMRCIEILYFLCELLFIHLKIINI